MILNYALCPFFVSFFFLFFFLVLCKNKKYSDTGCYTRNWTHFINLTHVNFMFYLVTVVFCLCFRIIPLSSYVKKLLQHFTQEGDSTVCMAVLSEVCRLKKTQSKHTKFSSFFLLFLFFLLVLLC